MKYKHLSRFVARIFLMILVSISLSSCVDANIDAQKQTPESVEDITQVIRIENADGLFSIDDGFVYFGRETCSTCNAFSPILAEVSSDNNVIIYYFDTGYFRENALLEESELKSIFDNYQVLSVPMVIEICDGQVSDTFTPKFNDDKNNTAEVSETLVQFLLE